MKTVVIIENEAVELKALVNLFEQWQKEINILTAREGQAAIGIMSQQQVDLVVCDLAPGSEGSLEDFSLLTHSFPYIPCIALAKGAETISGEALRRGASHCLNKPVDSSRLLLHAGELLDAATSGKVKGIPIHSFLQMLETEEKTCTLQVDRKNDTGLLYIKKGLLIGAETKNFTGEAAAQLILSWQESVIRIRFFNGQRKRQINKPLISLIMEAFRLSGERDQQAPQPFPEQKQQLPLKHLSTLGRRIPLEIGSRIKLEFPHLDGLADSVMVGMVKENCLIVTNPQPYSDLEELAGGEQRVVVKYVDKGRVWMFKARLLRAVDSPSQLLFFEYPGVIHYQDLRQTRRTAVFIPSTCQLEEKLDLYGTLIDLSTMGCLCLLRHKRANPLPPIDIDTKVLLRCLLPGIKEEQQISGKVRNMQVDPGETRIGIEFIDLQPHLADTIGQYLYSIESLEN